MSSQLSDEKNPDLQNRKSQDDGNDVFSQGSQDEGDRDKPETEQEISVEQSDEKQVEEMNALHQEKEKEQVLQDLESDSLSHSNAEKMSDRDRSVDELNSIIEEKENNDNNGENFAFEENDNKEGENYDNASELDLKVNAIHAENEQKCADAFVEEKLPALPKDETFNDIAFKEETPPTETKNTNEVETLVGNAQRSDTESNEGGDKESGQHGEIIETRDIKDNDNKNSSTDKKEDELIKIEPELEVKGESKMESQSESELKLKSEMEMESEMEPESGPEKELDEQGLNQKSIPEDNGSEKINHFNEPSDNTAITTTLNGEIVNHPDSIGKKYDLGKSSIDDMDVDMHIETSEENKEEKEKEKEKEKENEKEKEKEKDDDDDNDDEAFADAKGSQKYEMEELRQEAGEDEILKQIQVDDPSFDAGLAIDDKLKEESNAEDNTAKKVSQDADLNNEEPSSQTHRNEPTTQSNSVNIVSQVKQEPDDQPSLNMSAKETATATTTGGGATKPEPTKEAKSMSMETDDIEVQVEDEDEESEEEVIEDNTEEPAKEAPKYKQTHLIVIPSYASWFNMKKIHKIEKESLPEFFDSTHPSKSPKLYANYRNFMINAYRLNPNEFLTLTSCRRNLVGDVGTLMRVHRFLNKWGLINYQVRPQFKPGYALEKAPNGSSVELPYTGDYHVKFDTPRGLFPFDTSRIPPERVDVSKLRKLLQINNSHTSPTMSDNNGENRKHSATDDIPDDVKQPLKKKKKKQDDDGWTVDEYSKLVNAVKTYKNDWYQIADAVGSNKTPQQCVLKFLKMPLEDKFDPARYDVKAIAELLKFSSNYPVNSVDNPVLANLVFMTRIVDSEVAKVASEAASKAMDESMKQKVTEVYGDKEEKKASEGESTTGNKDTILEQNGHRGRDPDEKDAMAATFGIVGARSHLFACYEEREMNKISANIINHELAKVETKLSKIEELEKIYERERQNLAKQVESNFMDRLALTKSTIGVIKKLEEACNLLESRSEGKPDEVRSLIDDAKVLLYKPTKQSLEEIHTKSSDDTSLVSKSNADYQNDDYKPLSLTSPQTFRVWAP
ncbi:SWI3 [Candida oxycetoniae]|uniref:SWI3 n=1 Tax=Candida oxycetoniae TaxID=497107 RepID=A0AAI9SV94_9ASCO|nr:SWI3 [Candida oxycetoniae]KAI3403693.2 SWI3 [Candida oxycetoniae]